MKQEHTDFMAKAKGFTPQQLRSAMRLYAVSDSACLGNRELAKCVSEALAGGASFLQLRDKKATTSELLDMAKSLLPLCTKAHVPLVINDNVEAAYLSGAHGVHVGQSDMACVEARRLLGSNAIVGVSVQTLTQALAAEAHGADYLGVGAIFETPTKPDAELVSLAELSAICAAVHIPVVAIGGININTIAQLMGTGVDGVAVVSALFAADDIAHAAAELALCVESILEQN